MPLIAFPQNHGVVIMSVGVYKLVDVADIGYCYGEGSFIILALSLKLVVLFKGIAKDFVLDLLRLRGLGCVFEYFVYIVSNALFHIISSFPLIQVQIFKPEFI